MQGPSKKEGCTILSLKTSKKCTNTIIFGYMTQKNLRKKKFQPGEPSNVV